MSSAATPRSSDDATESPTLSSPTQKQYPFSNPDHQKRQNIINRTHVRRDFTASIASSIGGTLDTAIQPFGQVNELAHNAISSLLSPPIIRTGLLSHPTTPASSVYRAPTSRDIPPVALTIVPQIDSSSFKPYIAQIGFLFEQYKQSKVDSEDGSGQDEDVNRLDENAVPLGQSPRSDPYATLAAESRRFSGVTPPPASPDRRRVPSIALARRKANTTTPLATIPPIYFEDNFALENPRVFDVVSEHSEIIPPDHVSQPDDVSTNRTPKISNSTQRKALHTNAILQEKLSWYMDTVEVHLISSIATASSSFFAALGSLKDLEHEAAHSISRIKVLRAALANLDNEMAIGGFKVVDMRKRRDNLQKLGHAVDQVCEVVDCARRCDELVESGDFETASRYIERLEDLISGRPGEEGSLSEKVHTIDLRKLKALDGIAEGLENLRFQVGKGFETRFVDALMSDLRQHVHNVPQRDTLQRWANSSFRARGDQARGSVSPPAYMHTNDQTRPALLAALSGLSNTGQTIHAFVAYREAVMREIKSIIRRYLPSSNEDDVESVTSISTKGGRKLTQQEKSAILARNLRALDAEAAEDLLIKVYTAVSEALRRVGVQVKLLLDVTSTMDGPPTNDATLRPGSISIEISEHATSRGRADSTTRIRDEVMQALDLSSLLGQAVDVVQAQIAKVLRVRSEQTSHLDLQTFLRYFILNRLFTDECEAISSRPGDAVKEAVHSQVKEFVQIMADTEKSGLVQVLDADRWDAKDFAPTDATVLGRVLEGMTKTPKAWTLYSKLWEENIESGLPDPDTNVVDEETSEKVRSAVIEEQKYVLVQSVMVALRGIDQFENLMTSIPTLSVDVATRLLDYLRAFNSRCVQLILGAGATKSAGLKNITTKHLALASQACSFIVTLIPYIREFVRRQSPSANSMLPEFDRVKRLFQDHQASLHDKLVEIMSQRCHAHVNAMRRIDFEAPSDQETPNAYAEALAKETGTLHRVLSKHVPEMDLRIIMMPIFAHYDEEWTKALREVTLRSEDGRAR